MTMKTITFPKCKVEILPEQDVINNIITSVEAEGMVENLSNNCFSQLIGYGGQAVSKAGKSITSYDDVAKVVAEVVEKFKRLTMDEFEARKREIEKGSMVGEDKTDALNRIETNRARVNNSLKSGKSVIVNCLKHGEHILQVIEDGGHILYRRDGTARGKTELQNLLKKAKAEANPKKSELEQALDAANLLARRMVPLSASDRKLVNNAMRTKLAELDSEREEVEVDEEVVAEAA